MVTSYRETLVILLADVSGSMQATDVRPTRLYATISAFRDLADRLPKQDKIALVTFSDNVEIVVPPTRDHNTLDHGLEVLSPEGGTALGEGVAGAVRLAVTTLAADGIHRTPGQLLPAVIVLESDGAQDRGTVTPFAAAQLAKKAGIRIDGVALGTRYGTITRGTGLLKESFPVPPSPGTVGMLASLTGGEAFDATTARTLDLTLRSLASGAGRHPTRSDIAPWFELAGAVLLVASSAAALRLGAALP
ncbi:MAG: VWA domain-containing protein [Actinobacteria bacterium]|nr:VWA domain-containing protein [Actinomycetota bacterium]